MTTLATLASTTAPGDLEDVSITSLSHNACPAFQNSPVDDELVQCPFRNLGENVKGCPAFKESKCPFRETKTGAEMWDMMAEVPLSHRTAGTKSSNSFSNMMRQLHEVSLDRKTDLGECPVFAPSCPFKNLSSNGVPLVDEFEYRTWPGLFDDVSTANDAAPVSPHSKEQRAKATSLRLKKGTRIAHRAAENVQFVREFIKGNIPLDKYVILLQKLWVVYDTMEKEMRASADTVFAAVHHPAQLERATRLAEDLDYLTNLLGGGNWRASTHVCAPSPAVSDYVARVKAVARADPALLVAHSYTRYLGDLSGGQTLKRVARRSFNLPKTGSGSSFYDFPSIASIRTFKTQYKAGLDAIDLSAEQTERMVLEANEAFALNTRIFREMDVLCGLAALPSLQPEPAAAPSDPSGKQVSECPFGYMVSSTPTNNKKTTAAASSAMLTASNCPADRRFWTTQMQSYVVASVAVAAVLLAVTTM